MRSITTLAISRQLASPIALGSTAELDMQPPQLQRAPMPSNFGHQLHNANGCGDSDRDDGVVRGIVVDVVELDFVRRPHILCTPMAE